MSLEFGFFILVAAAAIVSAIFMATRPNPVKSALFLIVNFFCLAILYLLLQAQLIAIIQILVYAGAIMVLFLFVIMLLNVGDESKLAEKTTYRKLIALALGLVVFAEIAIGMGLSLTSGASELPAHTAEMGTVESIGRALYTEFLLPFEVTSMLLLAAMVGVIVLAKKKFR